MEENNLNNEAPVETPVVSEPVVEAPMPETKVEEVAPVVEPSAWEKYKVSAAEEPKDSGVITTSNLSQGSDRVQGMGSVANGVIGATEVERKPAPVAAPAKKKVVIHSTKNVSLPGVGKVYRGYNVVTPEQADKWLERNHTRLATDEEVAKEFGR